MAQDNCGYFGANNGCSSLVVAAAFDENNTCRI